MKGPLSAHKAEITMRIRNGETYGSVAARFGVSDVAVRKHAKKWVVESRYRKKKWPSKIRISRNPPARRPTNGCIVCHTRPQEDGGTCDDPLCREVWHWFLSRGGPKDGAPLNRSDLIGLYALTRYIEWHANTQPNHCDPTCST